MEMLSVTSSNIEAIGYDDQNAILTIQFIKDSALYEYYDVPQHVFDELMVADSKGKYAHANIYNLYRQQRIR